MLARKLLAAALVAMTALPSIAAAEAGDDTIYFRVTDGEGCADQILYLDDEAGSPDESACGYIGGFSFDETGLFDPKVFGLDKGAAGFLLGAGEATGQIAVNHSNGAVGGGYYEIDLVLRVNGEVAGETTIAEPNGGVAQTIMDFTMDIDPAFDGTRVSTMSIDVLMGGVFVATGYMAAGNASFINLPRK